MTFDVYASKWEMLELSATPIPAVKQALKLSATDRSEMSSLMLLNETEVIERLKARMETKGDTAMPADEIKDTGAGTAGISVEEFTKLQEEVKVNAEKAKIYELGVKIGRMEDAQKFVAEGKSIDDFRDHALSLQMQPHPIFRDVDPQKQVKKFDMGALAESLMDRGNKDLQESAAYELAIVHEEGRESAMKTNKLAGAMGSNAYAIPLHRLAVTSSGAAGAIGVDPQLALASNVLVDYAAISSRCNIVSGLTNDIEFPVVTTGLTYAHAADGTAATNADPVIATVSLTPKDLNVATTISRRAMVQTSGWIDSFIRQMVSMGMSEQIDQGTLKGTGASNQPTGILETTGVDVVGTPGALTSMSYAHQTNAETYAIGGKHRLSNSSTFIYGTGAFSRARNTEGFTNTGITLVNRSGMNALEPYMGGGQIEFNTATGYRAVPTALLTTAAERRWMLFGDLMTVVVGIWDTLILRIDDTDASFVRVSALALYDVGVTRGSAFTVQKYT